MTTNLITTIPEFPSGQAVPTSVIASARGLVKTYGNGETAVQALAGIDVDFARGELTVIMGPSGSGKSTLMHCMAGLDTVTAGTVVIDGQDVGSMNQRQLTQLRRTRLGFIFQAFNLVPTLTAAENITLPLDIARR
ncbi:MAG: ABC transporter ATP-binding protein, partial [Cellulomonas sp.]